MSDDTRRLNWLETCAIKHYDHMGENSVHVSFSYKAPRVEPFDLREIIDRAITDREEYRKNRIAELRAELADLEAEEAP